MALLEVQVGVGRPTRKAGRGRGALQVGLVGSRCPPRVTRVVWKGSKGPPGGPGWVGRSWEALSKGREGSKGSQVGPGGVERFSRRAGMGLEALPEGRDDLPEGKAGLGGPPEGP